MAINTTNAKSHSKMPKVKEKELDSPDISITGLDEFAPYLMNRIMHRYNQSVQAAMHEHGLTTPKMRVLAALAAKGDLTVNELAIYAVSEQSTISRTLDQLEDAGLVARKTGKTDSRVRMVALTASGRRMYKRIWPDMQRAEAAMFDGFDARTKSVFLKRLEKMLRNIRLHEV